MRHPERGTCALAREWTDWSAPSPYDALGVADPPFEFEALWQLAVFVAQLEGREEG